MCGHSRRRAHLQKKKTPTMIKWEILRIEEYETGDKQMRKKWSYEKRNTVKEEEVEEEEPKEELKKKKTDSDLILLKSPSPLAHRLKQKRLEQREKRDH